MLCCAAMSILVRPLVNRAGAYSRYLVSAVQVLPMNKLVHGLNARKYISWRSDLNLAPTPNLRTKLFGHKANSDYRMHEGD